MKIGIITTTFPPIIGGMAEASYYHATLLAQHDADVHVYTQTLGHTDDTRYPFSVHRMNSHIRFGYAVYAPHIKKELQIYDALLIEYPAYGLAECAYQAGKKWDIPLFVYYHMDTIGKGIKGAIFTFHRKFFLPRMIQQAQGVLVASKDYARHSFLSSYSSLLKDRIHILPLGVDTRRFYPGGGAGDILRSLNIKRSDTIIGFVGGLDSQHYFKGVPVLLRALSELKRKYPLPSFKCVIVGDGDMRKGYERLAYEQGVLENVVFAGRVSPQDLPRYFQLFDMFVLPSTDQSEAFGLVLLEAMSSAKPVIVSDLPGPRSLVDHENDGYIFPIADDRALAQYLYLLLCDAQKRATMGACAREKVVNMYQWPVIGAQLYDYNSTHI